MDYISDQIVTDISCPIAKFPQIQTQRPTSGLSNRGFIDIIFMEMLQ